MSKNLKGTEIKELRDYFNISTNKLAERANISSSLLRAIEKQEVEEFNSTFKSISPERLQEINLEIKKFFRPLLAHEKRKLELASSFVKQNLKLLNE